MAAKRESLWEKYFEDPSQWWDNRNRKISPTFPDFKHKVTKECLWLDGYASPQLEEELRRKGLKGIGNERQFEPDKHETPFNIVGLLKACTTHKDLDKGCTLHAYIQEHNLQRNAYIGSSLVNMYAKCGALSKALQTLEELPIRNAVTWSALIVAYAQQGKGEEALKCFDDMIYEGHNPDAVTFACALNACGNIRAKAKGEEIHDKIVSLGMLEKDVVLRNTLVNMYTKCGALAKAQQVLEELPARNAVTWGTLIAGYLQQGQGREALNCYNDMLCEGHSPSAVTFTCALKACGTVGAVAKGKEIHDKIVSLGILENDIVLGNAMVDMYVKCDVLAQAQQVLQELPLRDVVTWSTLIAGFAEHGQGKEALKCFDDMLHEGHSPDAVTFISVLKACGIVEAVAKGEKIHEKIVSLGMLEKDIVLGNTLVDMYMKCGEFLKAQWVLEELPIRNAISWNSLIAGYIQIGQEQQALKCFDDMLCEGHSLDVITFAYALKACGSIIAVAKGQEIHDKIVSLGMLEQDIFLGNTLLDMYMKCGALVKAQRVLEELPIRNAVTWSTLITGYAHWGQGEKALKCFDDMALEGHAPDVVTFVSALKACGTIRATSKANQIYDKIVSLGMLEKDTVLGNALVDMHVKCGELVKAQQVIEELPVRTAVSWNILIAGYAQVGQGKEALKCFDDMLHEGHVPDAVTFICVLKACGSIGATAKGEEIHDKIVRLGLLEYDIVLGNTLVDMYTRFGALAKAEEVLEGLALRDVVTWGALIAGYAYHGLGEQALKCFDDMIDEGHSPDVVAFLCALKACGSIGAATKGINIHGKIVSLGILKDNMVLGNTVVDMYVKCGALFEAQHVLAMLPAQDMVTWSALIAGYAQQGQTLEAINCFEQMLSKGMKPNSISLICMLNSCSHAGLLDQAEALFVGMSTKYGIEPDLEHFCCMIDLFARAGKFEKSLSVIAKMPSDKCLPNWVALLGACRKWGEVKIGRLAFERALHLDKSNDAVYLLMADIYTTTGMQDEADKVEIMRLANNA